MRSSAFSAAGRVIPRKRTVEPLSFSMLRLSTSISSPRSARSALARARIQPEPLAVGFSPEMTRVVLVCRSASQRAGETRARLAPDVIAERMEKWQRRKRH